MNDRISEENLEIIEKYRPLDDDFIRELLRNNIPLSEMIIRIITGKYDLKIVSLETQYDMKRLSGARSLCLDAFARDSAGKLYNVEIDRSDARVIPKRARYHSSLLDAEFLKAGEDFSDLPVTYVIFITENDVRGGNRPLYHFERRDAETGEPFGDETHIIYANASYSKEGDDSDIAKLMHDFRCSNADDMYFELLAEKTRYFKRSEKGVSQMSKLMEDRINAAAEAAADGRY